MNPDAVMETNRGCLSGGGHPRLLQKPYVARPGRTVGDTV